MYIDKIEDFLREYNNMSREGLLEILNRVNTEGFDELKLEKDFILTLILIKFGQKYPDLVFKGGTCLNKIYFPYFRLSEDLDFTLDIELGEGGRKRLLKKYEEDFTQDLGILGMRLLPEQTKYDMHRVAVFNFEYISVVNNTTQTIKIDISLKARLQLPVVSGLIQSLYTDSIFEESIFGQHTIGCIDLQESTAEKLRAALTRKKPAIRDFFDIWYLQHQGNFDFGNPDFQKLLDIKLQEAGYVYTLDGTGKKDLQKQVETDLKPVLNNDFGFDFEEIYAFVMSYKK